MFADSLPSASNFKSFSESLEQYFFTVGQNNFTNKIPFPSFQFRVEKNSLRHSTLQERPLRAMCNPKYIKYGLLGQAWKPVVVYLVVHIICIIFYANLDECKYKIEGFEKVRIDFYLFSVLFHLQTNE